MLLGFLVFLLMRMPRVGLVVLVLVLGVFTTAIFGWKPIYKTRTPEFAAAVKSVQDPAELQTWAMTILREAKESGTSPKIPTSKVPENLRKLSITEWGEIEDVIYDAGSTGSGQNATIWLTWGGGFGHWGLIICQGKPQLEDTQGLHAVVTPLSDGVFIWEEL